MDGQSLQAVIEAFRTFANDKGWIIVKEKEIQYGYQLIVTDGVTKTPVALFSSGKMLAQGKITPLQREIKAWRYIP